VVDSRGDESTKVLLLAAVAAVAESKPPEEADFDESPTLAERVDSDFVVNPAAA
jgi:hypothetical protein